MSNLSIRHESWQYGTQCGSEKLTLIPKDKDQILVDLLTINDSGIQNTGIYLSRMEVSKLANWLDDFLYSTRENGTPAFTEKTQQKKAGKVR